MPQLPYIFLQTMNCTSKAIIMYLDKLIINIMDVNTL